MKEFIRLSEEKNVFESGHTLSLIQRDNDIYAYKGEADFSKIELWSGKNIYNLEYSNLVFNNMRWATITQYRDVTYLCCTERRGNYPDTFKYQNIHVYVTYDHIEYNSLPFVIDGSAPWLYHRDNITHLYFHRKTNDKHLILVKRWYSFEIDSIGDAKEHIILESPLTHTLSAPSVIYWNGLFWMMCESCNYSDKGYWETVLYVSDNPIRNYVFHSVVLTDNRACAFQHIINNRYILTYSTMRDNGIWKLCAKEGLITVEPIGRH